MGEQRLRDDRVAIRAALLQLRKETGLPVVFGGPVLRGRRLQLSELVGTVTNSLQGLAVAPGSGLGGKVVALGRVLALNDYPSARGITHDYDAAVGAEGLRAIIAVPVVVRRTVRGVLYGAARNAASLGDRTLGAAVDTARGLEQNLVVRDELDGRRTSVRAFTEAGSQPWNSADWEEVRAAHTELRLLAQDTDDDELRAQLQGVCDRLAAAQRRPGTPAPVAALTPRELDVLVCVAAGCTNAESGRSLGLRPETVKSYLRQVMRKLGTHGRLETVIAARRAGLLP
ncbi:GAF modulated transcriptional regulator, LuxR family [Amycolatopsis marina]|uniref:GAF modulated transcriptional regulator, LuxR family n=1 Tax=Amycolatopsis marina TaxID=490629 RepID=A0A1I0XHU6_9PSEU|nr:helix-turn-helix transcriptional regulator [Amycolatopsis marina]SFB00669.1 GAF modulated transcriptional regulator, LuxR family [Amycolatopsis marina]